MSGTPINGSASSTSWTTPGAGITGGYNGDSETLRIFIVFFAGLAIYNACELIIMLLLTFNRYRGLYFWTLLIAASGIIPYAVGFIIKFLNLTTGKLQWLAVVLLTIGWYPMITGQSLVLWSRLHLIVSGEHGDKILKRTKWMIIVDAFILHIPTTVLTFGSNGYINTQVFVTGYSIMEKIQMIGFFLQEATLSTIYIIETSKILRTSLNPRTRTIMKQLIFINCVILALDLGILALEAASLYILEVLLKALVYSIKLKLEFAILGKLVKFVGTPQASDQVERNNRSISFINPSGDAEKQDQDMNIGQFVDLTRVQSDLTHASHENSNATRRRHSCYWQGHDFEYDMAQFEHVEEVSTLAKEDAETISRDSSMQRQKSGAGHIPAG